MVCEWIRPPVQAEGAVGRHHTGRVGRHPRTPGGVRGRHLRVLAAQGPACRSTGATPLRGGLALGLAAGPPPLGRRSFSRRRGRWTTPASPKTATTRWGWVQRQYCGTLGKTANCQLGVSVNAVTEQASCPLDWRLFLPESWAELLSAACSRWPAPRPLPRPAPQLRHPAARRGRAPQGRERPARPQPGRHHLGPVLPRHGDDAGGRGRGHGPAAWRPGRQPGDRWRSRSSAVAAVAARACPTPVRSRRAVLTVEVGADP